MFWTPAFAGVTAAGRFTKPSTFAFDKYGFGVMEKPVKDRRGECGIVVEDFGPVF